MQAAGLCVERIAARAPQPGDYLGFVEVHIEQGPVLNELRPAAGHRHLHQRQRALHRRGAGHRQPRGHHAHGPAPRCCSCGGRAAAFCRTTRPPLTATRWAPWASCSCPMARSTWCPDVASFRSDLRAPSDAQRDALERDVLASAGTHLPIARRGLHTHRKPCAPVPRPAHPPGNGAGRLRSPHWACPCTDMPSGAGHDAMKLHDHLAPGHAVCARPKRGHQPQPAGVHHQLRHAARRGRIHPPAGATGQRPSSGHAPNRHRHSRPNLP